MSELSPRRAYAVAQSELFTRFREGDFSIVAEKLRGGVESDIAMQVEALCANTYALMTDIIGIQPDTLTPILDGGSVQLEGSDREAFLSHLTRAYAIEHFSQKRIRDEYRDTFLASWDHFVDIATIQIHGPVVRIEMDAVARESLELVHDIRFAGMAAMIPLQPPDRERSRNDLGQYGEIPIQCIFIDTDEVPKDWRRHAIQDLERHEWQHILDVARTDILVRMRRKQLKPEVATPIERRVIRALSRSLFDPESTAATLNYLIELEREFIVGYIP